MHEFLADIKINGLKRDAIRRTARSKNKAAIVADDSADNNRNIDNFLAEDFSSGEKTFQYFSPDNNFNLEIHFHNSEVFSKKDVLKALKETFDRTKN